MNDTEFFRPQDSSGGGCSLVIVISMLCKVFLAEIVYFELGGRCSL